MQCVERSAVFIISVIISPLPFCCCCSSSSFCFVKTFCYGVCSGQKSWCSAWRGQLYLLSVLWPIPLLLLLLFVLFCEDILLWSLQWSAVLMQCMERSAVFIISVMPLPFPLTPFFFCVWVFCFVLWWHFVMVLQFSVGVTLFSLSVLKHLSDLAWIWHIFKEITDTFVYRPPSHDRNCNTSFLFETGEIWKCFMMMTSFERYTSYQVY